MFYRIILTIIFVFNVILRVGWLENQPSSMNFDEAALGYNAYSLLKTSRDEYGNFMPLSLRSFNDFKPALYAYLSIPVIKILGLNQTSTRLVSALAGVVALIPLFWFIRYFVKQKWLAIFFWFIISLEPWRLHYSRTAFESNLSACFFAWGAWYLFESIIAKKIPVKKLLMSIVSMVLAIYSYHGARLAVPILIFLTIIDPIEWFIVKRFNLTKKIFWSTGLTIVIVGILSLPIFLENGNLILTRLKQENLIARYSPFAPTELIESMKFDVARLAASGYYFGSMVSGRLLSSFSPVNLTSRIYHWVKGSDQYIPQFGLLGWLEGILLVIGIVVILRELDYKKYRFLVYWIVAGSAPAAMTWTWFHPLRALNIMPALEMVAIIGSITIFYKSIYKWVGVFVAGLWVLQIIFVINNELGYSNVEIHGEYQPGGFKEGIPLLEKLQKNYDQILIDSPHAQSYIFFLFYQAYPPEEIQKYASIRPQPGIGGDLSFDFDKYIFTKYDWPNQKDYKKTLWWVIGEVKESEIYRETGTNIYRIGNAVRDHEATIITKD